MTWWSWMILGAIIFGAEMFAIDAQFYLVFLGLSAIIVGLMDLAGVAMPEWAQWAAFGTLSLVSMITFRKSLYEKIRGGAPGFRDSMAGVAIELEAELPPGEDARTNYRGTDWTVRNVGTDTIAAGSRARVIKTEGLELHVSND